MFSVMPVTSNKIALFTVTVDGKPCIRTREVYRMIECGKTVKNADTLNHLFSLKNYARKSQLTEFFSGLKKSQYEEVMMYKLLFPSQQPKQKNKKIKIKKHWFNAIFTQMVEQLRHRNQQAISLPSKTVITGSKPYNMRPYVFWVR